MCYDCMMCQHRLTRNAKGFLISSAVSSAKVEAQRSHAQFWTESVLIKVNGTENHVRDISDIRKHRLSSLLELDSKSTCKRSLFFSIKYDKF